MSNLKGMLPRKVVDLKKKPSYSQIRRDAPDTAPLLIFFTNAYSRQMVSWLQTTKIVRSEDEATDTIQKMFHIMRVYALLVYDVYPNWSEFQKKIRASKELWRNFSEIKFFLDRQNGEKWIEKVKSEWAKTKR